MHRIAITISFLFLSFTVVAQDLAIGIKGGYCRYLAVDKTPFYELTPHEGYSGRLCGEIFTRIENKRGFFTEFGLTRLSNEYNTSIQSDHGGLPYRATQHLYLANFSFQFKIQCKSIKNVYGYVGPSFSLGFADIDESFSQDHFLGMALVPGTSQGIVYTLNRSINIVASLDARYLLLYNESTNGLGFMFDRNTLLMGQLGLFYSIN